MPDRSLQEDQGGRYLLIVNKDDVVEQRYVQLGQLDGVLRVITSGLKPDDPRGGWRSGGAPPPAPRSSRSLRRSRQPPWVPSHDVEVLYRAPGPCANVLAIVLVLIGAICVFKLPVAQYPNIVPPTVQVTTRYPGASAQTVLDTIALPIELQVNGVPGMIYMQSTSAYDGTYNLTVTFEIGSDPNFDQVLVQNRVQNAMAQLPQARSRRGCRSGQNPRRSFYS